MTNNNRITLRSSAAIIEAVRTKIGNAEADELDQLFEAAEAASRVDPVLSRDEVARALDICVESLDKLHARGEGPPQFRTSPRRWGYPSRAFGHPRKLAPGEVNTTVDDARGASAILGAVRLARTLNFMTTGEASQLGIHEDERRKHVRVENGKANPGPIGKANWLKISVENLPNGDEVACATPWQPPDPFDDVSAGDVRVVQGVARSGRYRTNCQSPDWLGWWMAENLPHLGIKARSDDRPRDKGAIAKLNSILKTWVKNDVLQIEERCDETRQSRSYYVVGNCHAAPAATADNDQVTLQ